jgi:oligopeptide transport system substrate-binding protein
MGTGLVLMLLLAACQPSGSASPSADGSEAPASEAPAAEQVLRVVLGTEPPTLDPNLATDSESVNVLRQITHPLVYFDADLGIAPGIADPPEVSADGMTLTYTLREGFSYSDGEPIVAGDFVYSWKRLIDPRTASEYSYVLDAVANGAEIRNADPATDDIDAMLEEFGVAAPDDQTFVVTLGQPATWFVYVSTMWLTVPIREDMEGTFGEAEGYIASGPMMLEEWNHGASVHVVPNPGWGGDPVTLERIEYSVIADSAVELAAYEAGDLDIASPPPAEIPRLEEDPVVSQEILRGNTLNVEYYGFDLINEDGPFARSPLLRKAFYEAVDIETMIAVPYGGVGAAASSLVPPGMPGYQEDVFVPFDVEQAQADFAAGLEELGLSGPEDLTLQIGYNTEGTHADRVAFLQETWRDAFGVELEPVGMEFGTYLDRLSSDPFDIFRLGWIADFPHPHNFLFDLLGCTSPNNNVGYCNEEADELMAQAAVEADADAQIALYNQVQEMQMADVPLMPFRWGGRFTLVKPYVQDLTVTPLDPDAGAHFYSWVTIAAHEEE